MIRAIFVAIMLALMGVGAAQTQTLHRLPLAYIPYPINAWKDDNASVGTDTRYDGTNIPAGAFYYDQHRGVDFGAPYGTTVYASATGTIFLTETTCAPNGGFRGNTCGFGFGNFVALSHADGLVSVVAHLSSVSYTTPITCVSGPGGKQLGVSGNSGDTSGAHLHFELRLTNLSGSSPSYDPFGGSSSTQAFHRWRDWANVYDTLKGVPFTMPYPTTLCQ